MSRALYRKYRSQTFDEVVGQDHITTVLSNSLKSKKLSHAYLFTGPKGVGKTSVARILARNANNIQKDDNNFYPDIVEIDAASNRRIDEVRELREKVVIAPSQLKYKVYIIDEVHMLTREAFNALLKTLEEPPSHAIFILATTDFHKVPETIVSRCMRLSFRPIAPDDTVSHLKSIAKKEKIKIDDAALQLISEHSEGSFRDAISMLDQLSSVDKPIDTSLVELMLGMPNKATLHELLEHVKAGDLKNTLLVLEKLFFDGATAGKLIFELSKVLRQSIGGDEVYLSNQETLDLLDNLSKSYGYSDQRLGLEIALLKIANIRSDKSGIKAEIIPPTEPKAIVTKPKKSFPVESKKPETITPAPDAWHHALDKLKASNSTIYGIARMAEVSFDDQELHLGFKFSFHHKQMSLDRNKSIIFETFKEIGFPIKSINVSLIEQTVQPIEKKNDVSSLSNIFGSVEVLES